MMKWIMGGLISVSVIVGIITGNISEVSNAAIDSGTKAAQLSLALLGTMGLWGGLMRIAEKSGLTNVISKLFRPVAKFLFKGISPDSEAFRAISMNITANLLGLGNAATPLGIDAMKKLEKADNPGETASRNMIMLAVLNTASIQILPTTVAALRLAYGSQTPLDILPAVLLTSLCSVCVGITLVFVFDKKGGRT